MPRDGSGNYNLPAGTVGLSGAPANVTHVNSRFSDLESDANAARPVSAGGTGATSAAAARTALGVDAAGTKGVTGSDANAVTGTAGTDGNLSQWNADGDLVDGPAYGTAANEVLQLDGSGLIPYGSYDGIGEYIATYTVTSSVSTLELPDVDDTKYGGYDIDVEELTLSANTNLALQVSVGDAWKSGGSDNTDVLLDAANSVSANRDQNTSSIRLKGNANNTYSGEVTVRAAHSATIPTKVKSEGTAGTGSNTQLVETRGFEQSAGNLDNIRLLPLSGTIETATVHLYGRRTS